MTIPTSVVDELRSLADIICDGVPTDRHARRLEDLLGGNAEAQRFYLACVRLDGYLRWECRNQIQKTAAPQPSHFPTTLHSTANFLSSGWPVAYLIATVIFTTGMLVAAFTYVSQPEQIAATRPASATRLDEPLAASVGHITGMADCQWAEGIAPLLANEVVPVGREIRLESGLMEIAYDSGAKVVLQGPVTYQVESAAGGYLAVGKLTARVDKRAEGGGRKAEAVAGGDKPVASGQWLVASEGQIRGDHVLTTRHSPLFTIKTPTATVTDLGTEFGVEVAKDKSVEVHVIAGAVEASRCDAPGRDPQTVRLVAGKACRYQAATGQSLAYGSSLATPIPMNWDRFKQMQIEQPKSSYQRWLAYSRQLRQDPALVAYYTFEKAGADNSVLPNLSSAGSVLDGRVEGAEWVHGRLPGKYGLFFHGPKSGDKVMLPQQERFKFSGPFSVAVWSKVDRFLFPCNTWIAKGDRSWRLHWDHVGGRMSFDTNARDITPVQSEVADGRWHLMTFMYEPDGDVAVASVYVDGRLEVNRRIPAIRYRDNEPVWLGANSEQGKWDKRGGEFWGVIDEVAILSRAMSVAEVCAMFDAGNPAKSAGHQQQKGGSGN